MVRRTAPRARGVSTPGAGHPVRRAQAPTTQNPLPLAASAYFDEALFGGGPPRALQNIGGIANVTVVGRGLTPLAFDTGPGNTLLDQWMGHHNARDCDDAGQWAASGKSSKALLEQLLTDPYFAASPPKSTGRDLFNPSWLAQPLQQHPSIAAVDVQATLTEFTAQACANDVMRHAPDARELIVCGGGALNGLLMERLQAGLPASCQVVSSAERGMPALQVEATAFAWLARQTVLAQPGNAPKVTGAKGARILGAIYPA